MASNDLDEILISDELQHITNQMMLYDVFQCPYHTSLLVFV